MRIAASLLLIALGLVLLRCSGRGKAASAEQPKAPLGPAASKGEAIFYAKCAVCHDAKPGTPGAGPHLAGIFQAGPHKLSDGTEITGSEQSIRDFVLHGNSNMPPVGQSLSPQEMNDLFAYLHTL